MFVPVQCFGCGSTKPNQMYPLFQKLVSEGMDTSQAIEKLGIPPRKYCCRMLILSFVDHTDSLLRTTRVH
jgi:DNA-directed RNA polymerase subunit N (RpoN/RPB10)